MKKLIAALAMTFLMVIAVDISNVLAEPKPKEGNPGLPGCLAEVNQLEQQIADRQSTIVDLQGQIAELQTALDAMENYAPVAKTGQTHSYHAYDDGWYKIGVALPVPRFSDNGDGTVTDNLTKLVWLKDADRFGTLSWEAALNACNSLADDGVDLTDGSSPGDWRLPNIKELLSLLGYGYWYPCLTNALGTGKYVNGDPFVDVSMLGGSEDADAYWSSTTVAEGSSSKFRLNFVTGEVRIGAVNLHVWPVRNAN